jgi:hypothetical protein
MYRQADSSLHLFIRIMNVSTNQVADSLERSTEHEDEYMIGEKELLVNKFVLFLPSVYVSDTLTS